MPLIKLSPAAETEFAPVADDAPLPAGPVLVSAERLFKEKDALLSRTAPLGVVWPNSRDVAELVPLLPHLALVALVLPKFRDGRAFSQARLLRERHGFTGELRATGNVLRDQVLILARSGFNAFELEKEADAAAFDTALSSYSIFYQPTGDGRPTVAATRAGQA